MTTGATLLLGGEGEGARDLAAALGAEVERVPSGADDAALEAWRRAFVAGPPLPAIVVALLGGPPAAGELCEIERAAWDRRADDPLVAWCVALGAASRRIVDGGALVAVVDAPAALDAAGWAPETGLADAVIALVRSLAQSEGARGVRVNALTTPARLGPARVALPVPPLGSFPGTLAGEVAGAVRLLLSDDAVGLTARAIPVDCGRSL